MEAGTKTGEAALLDKLRAEVERKVSEANEAITAKLNNTERANEALRQEINALKSSGGAGGERKKRPTVGGLVISNERFMDSARRNKQAADVDISAAMRALKTERKRAIRAIGTSTAPLNAQGLDPEVYYQDLKPEPTVSDLIPTIPVSSTNAVRYDVRTFLYDLGTTLAAQSTAGATSSTLTNAQGVVVGSTLVFDPEGAGNGPESVTVTGMTPSTGVITHAATSNTHASGSVVKATEYGPTAEGETSPELTLNYAPSTASMKSLRTHVKVNADALDDSDRLEAEINMELPDNQARAKSRHALYGTGANEEFDGILSNSSIQTIAWSGQSSGTTRLDLLRLAIKMAHTSNRRPGHIIIHSDDLADIELQKDNSGQYIVDGKTMLPSGEMLAWRVLVVETNEINSGTALVANFARGARFYDPGIATMDMTNSDGTDFLKDRVTFRAKERLAFAVVEPLAFVKVTFDSAP